MCQLVLDETGLLPHANAGALFPDELARLRSVAPSQGMMIETLRDDLECHRGSPDKTPARRLATLDAAGELAIPFTTGILVGIGEDAIDRVRALEAIAESHARHGHVQEVIVQNFLPKPGTGMHREPPCPHDDYVQAIALARLILPADVHVQAPPNLSDDFGVLLDAGIDDWGGVSPVTADHVNPERPWPALERLREVTEARGFALAPRPDHLPRVRPPTPLLSRRGVALPRPRPLRRRRSRPRRPLVLGPRGPAAAAGSGPRLRRWAGGRGPRRRAPRTGARRRGDHHAVRGARSRGGGRRPGGRRLPAGRRRRCGHLRPEPEHQLHQRVHLQVPVLRLLEGSAVAQPAGQPVPAHPRRDRRPGTRGLGAWAPRRSACRAGSIPTSTATTTST